MNYLELTKEFETQMKTNLSFELLELHYTPYSFGSGISAYRIKGRIIKVIFDGKDDMIELMISARHSNYPCSDWTTIFTGHQMSYIDNGLIELNKFLDL